MSALSKTGPATFSAHLEYSVFVRAMANACRVSPKSAIVPILGAVRITHTPNGAHVTATDLDSYTKTFVPGHVDRGFDFVIDAHKLLAVVKRAKEAATISLSYSDSTGAVVTIGKLTLNVTATFELSDWPNASFAAALDQSAWFFTIPTAKLLDVFQKIEDCISIEEVRYYLNGIYMHLGPRKHRLNFVATDGHRLGCYSVSIPDHCPDCPDRITPEEINGVIIPFAAVAEVIRLTKRRGVGAETIITVAAAENGTKPPAICFHVGGEEALSSKLIDGTFPDYPRVIPQSNDKRITADSAVLADTIKQVMAVSSERTAATRFNAESGRLHLTVSNPDFGAARSDMSVTYDADPVEIGFNASYVRDMLGHLGSQITIDLADSGSPALIRTVGDDELLYVLMPLRV